MLKSQAPSRLLNKGQRQQAAKNQNQPTGSHKRKATTSTATPRTERVPGWMGAPAVVSRSPIPAVVEVSSDREGVDQPRSARGWQDPRPQFSMTPGADQNKRPASTDATATSSATPAAAALRPVRRVKKRQQEMEMVPPSDEIEWRVALPSRTSMVGSEARVGASKVGQSPAKRAASSSSGSSSSSSGRGSGRIGHDNSASSASRGKGGAAKTANGSKNSNAGTDSARSPREKQKKRAAGAAAGAKRKVAEEKEEEEEGKEDDDMPECPYPGHKNVSWVCQGCGGARHHLKSRNAMEPLRSVHGFKVERVANDGDCFFSSIQAALREGAAGDKASGSASSGTGEAGRGLTVAQMREWVAEETGQEQLDFYILQAGANPQDRWLDFVRPFDERVPSDDEEEEEEEDDDDSYKEEDAETASAASSSQSQGDASRGSKKKGAAAPSKPTSRSRRAPRPSRAAAATRNQGEEAKGKGRMGEGKGKGKGGRAVGSGGDEEDTASERGTDQEEDVAVMTVVAPSPTSDRAARRLGRLRNGGRGQSAVADSVAAAADASNKKNKKAGSGKKPSSSSSSSSQLESAARAAAAAGRLESPSRKSARPRRGRQQEGARRAGDGSVAKEERAEKGGKEGGEEEEEEEDTDGEGKEDQKEGLPFVQNVEELRLFIRREGSVVGHGNCLWADTFAHHVISRRLNITILFIDMERDKTAWPYRVLARTVTGGDNEEDERFVVLKREPSHFVLVKTAPAREKDKEGGGGAARSRRGGGGGGGGGGVGGQACFSRSDLPDVVRQLWQLGPAVKQPPTSPY